jgi:hypothetical protein
VFLAQSVAPSAQAVLGWRDKQLADGAVICTAPDGRTHTTTPGSRLLFPALCELTAPVIATDVPAQPARTAGLRMPRRNTRTQDRGRRIGYERELNAAAAERAAPTPPHRSDLESSISDRRGASDIEESRACAVARVGSSAQELSNSSRLQGDSSNTQQRNQFAVNRRPTKSSNPYQPMPAN